MNDYSSYLFFLCKSSNIIYEIALFRAHIFSLIVGQADNEILASEKYHVTKLRRQPYKLYFRFDLERK